MNNSAKNKRGIHRAAVVWIEHTNVTVKVSCLSSWRHGNKGA